MVVYIAGKMTGLEDKGRGKFAEAENELKKAFVVINPSVLPDGMPGDRYMPICFSMIDQADAIVMLDNWKDSPGAKLEKAYAEYQGKAVFYLQKKAPMFPGVFDSMPELNCRCVTLMHETMQRRKVNKP